MSCAMKTGAMAGVIVDTAAADNGTLIAMAMHGQTGGQRWLLGKVAQKVLQAPTSPLLLVRPKGGEVVSGEARIKTIIVPLDGSPLAEKIFSILFTLRPSWHYT